MVGRGEQMDREVSQGMSQDGSRDSGRDVTGDARQEAGKPGAAASRHSDEAIEVLRGVWSARGQSGTDLEDAFGPQKSCKNMQNVGFDDLAGSDGDIRSAWRSTLEREGKLNKTARSVRDLVLGTSDKSP